MSRLVLVALTALTGCASSHAAPSLHSIVPGEARENVVAVGQPILISGDWGQDHCKTYHDGPNLLEWFLGDKRPDSSFTDCRDVPYHVKLACSAPCSIWNETTVTPRTTGPLVVYATIERDDTGEQSHAAFHYNALPRSN